MADKRRNSRVSVLQDPITGHESEHPSDDSHNEPPPELLVEVDPDTAVVRRTESRTPAGDGEESSEDSSSAPSSSTTAHSFGLYTSATGLLASLYSRTPKSPRSASAPSSPPRASSTGRSQGKTEGADDACDIGDVCPVTELPKNNPKPTPSQPKVRRRRKTSHPKPHTNLTEDTKRLLAYQREVHSPRQASKDPLSPVNGPPSETTINTILNMAPSTSSSTTAEISSTRLIHQLHPTALNDLLDDNTEPAAPKWLIFTTFGTTLSFSSSVPTKQARAVAALVGLTWRSMEGEQSEQVNVAKHHIQSTSDVTYLSHGLQSAIFQVCGLFAAVSLIKEKLLVAAMCDGPAVHADDTARDELRTTLITKNFSDELAHLQELGVDVSTDNGQLGDLPGFAPPEARELASKILAGGEQLMKRQMGAVSKLRALALKAEGMAEQIAAQMDGLAIPDGTY